MLGQKGIPYVLCHVFQSTNPIGHIEVGVAKPSIPIGLVTAPTRLDLVIIQMHEDSTLGTSGSDGVKSLGSISSIH
jgi:hypothetical protein